MQLTGFGFSGYRSFGDELTIIGPLKKVNLIIGQNNAGKSNIIRFLKHQYAYFVNRTRNQRSYGTQPEVPFKDVDRHISQIRANHRIAFPVFKEDLADYLAKKIPNDNHAHIRPLAERILHSEAFLKNGVIWFTYKSSTHNGQFELEFEEEKLIKVLSANEWSMLWNVLTSRQGGGLKEHWFPETIRSLSYIPEKLPNVEVIPAIRKIGLAGSEAQDYSGEGIIERLAKIQNPSLVDQESKEKFLAINKFVQEVLETASAKIEIPYGRDMILVHMDGKTLPLESLGTGVHEVIILAAAATLLENTILCMEEPELHLHPLLQRKLIKYLSERTQNQYFFTTHSAHLLDAVDAEIFHVTQDCGVSKVDAISSTKQKSNVCNDLGYKASDILQANCIIWVEGPSDRLYLNFWLKEKNPKFIEGIHYSVMFYGGRLCSHLTALDDDEVKETIEDFVSVRNLNRNSVILFDSDKDRPRAILNSTKKRLKEEFDSGPGFAWVTKGREVENYLNYDNVEACVKAVHPSAKSIDKGVWKNLLNYKKSRSDKTITANKVKIARYYIENYSPNLDHLDLSKRINQLCDFISKSNGSEF